MLDKEMIGRFDSTKTASNSRVASQLQFDVRA